MANVQNASLKRLVLCFFYWVEVAFHMFIRSQGFANKQMWKKIQLKLHRVPLASWEMKCCNQFQGKFICIVQFNKVIKMLNIKQD